MCPINRKRKLETKKNDKKKITRFTNPKQQRYIDRVSLKFIVVAVVVVNIDVDVDAKISLFLSIQFGYIFFIVIILL